MNYFNKKNLAIIAIVVLLIVNISTIATVVYLSYKKPEVKRGYSSERTYKNVRKKMKFDAEQRKLFKEVGTKYQQKVIPIQRELDHLKKLTLDELSKANPDTNILYGLAENSAKLVVELKKYRLSQLIELKKSWNPEQYELLDKVFRDALENEDNRRRKREKFRKGSKQKRH